MLLNNKFRAGMPGPMDYMKNKIERMRENLVVVDTAAERQAPSIDMSTASSSCVTRQSEDASSATSDTTSMPSSPLLPVYRKDGLVGMSDNQSGTLMMAMMRQPVFLLCVTVAVFAATSTATAILDRFNLYQATYKFPFPLTHLFSQLVMGEALLLLSVFLSQRIALHYPTWQRTWMPCTALTWWDFSMIKTVAPVSISYLLMGAAFISSLEYVPMNCALLFLTPCMLLQLALSKYFTPDAAQSRYVAASCMLLMVGHGVVALSTSTPGVPQYNTVGILAGLTASMAIPIHNCLVKKTLPLLQHDAAQMLHCMLVTCIFAMFPLLLISGELFDISASCFFLDEAGFWGMMLLLGVLSFLACVSQFMLLISTSSLTLVVIMFTKAALIQLPTSNVLNGNPLTLLTLFGMLLSVAGAGIYAHLSNVHRPRFGLAWQS